MLSNISRSKDNQTMTSDHLIECNMKNIFLKKSYTNYGGRTSAFSEKLKLSITANQKSKVLYSSLLLYAKFSAIKIY